MHILVEVVFTSEQNCVEMSQGVLVKEMVK